MRNRRNKIGIGILSLSLALALPLNANATENKLIEDNEVKKEEIKPETNQTPSLLGVFAPRTEQNINYLSQRGREGEDNIQVTAYPVEFKAENKGADNVAQLSYMFGITGTGLPEDYTISVFALKDSKVKNFELDNFISEKKVTLAGEEMAKTAEKIVGDDIFGFRIKTKIEKTGSVKAIVTVGNDDEAGDYSLYYMVSTKDKTTVGKIDANLEKIGAYDFVKTNEEPKRDYNTIENKANPFENLPFTKYLLNDTNQEKKLTDYMDLYKSDFAPYKLVATYINPNGEEVKTEGIVNLKEYIIPANSLLRFDIRDVADTTNLIKDSEIAAYDLEVTEDGKAPISLMSLMKNDQIPKQVGINASSDINSLIEAEKTSLRKIYPKIDAETLEVKSLSQAISKQSEKLKELINGQFVQIPAMAQSLSKTIDDKEKDKQKSVIEINANTDVKNIDAKDLTIAIRDVTTKIHELIQQAMLDYELDNLTKLEKENPEKAKEEYKKIAQLVKEAKDVSKKANTKLIELDEIILTDNQTDPLLTTIKGAKPVLNLGMLTPLTKINNLTKDSPKESERDFSTNLEKKLKEATKKVETVTISDKEDKKADKKVDIKEEKENKEEKTQETIETKINTPIFVKYLQALNSRGKLLDNK